MNERMDEGSGTAGRAEREVGRLAPERADIMPAVGLPLVMRDDLPPNVERSWRGTFGRETWYLIGWCDAAFSVVPHMGSNRFEHLSGSVSDYFSPA